VKFTVPSSVECTGSLDDPQMQREMGLTCLGRDGRKRLILEGSPAARASVIDSTLNLAGDHVAEDPYDTLSRNALVWAKREAARAIEAGWAKPAPYGGIDAI
jgi:hypothetical protein